MFAVLFGTDQVRAIVAERIEAVAGAGRVAPAGASTPAVVRTWGPRASGQAVLAAELVETR